MMKIWASTLLLVLMLPKCSPRCAVSYDYITKENYVPTNAPNTGQLDKVIREAGIERTGWLVEGLELARNHSYVILEKIISGEYFTETWRSDLICYFIYDTTPLEDAYTWRYDSWKFSSEGTIDGDLMGKGLEVYDADADGSPEMYFYFSHSGDELNLSYLKCIDTRTKKEMAVYDGTPLEEKMLDVNKLGFEGEEEFSQEIIDMAIALLRRDHQIARVVSGEYVKRIAPIE